MNLILIYPEEISDQQVELTDRRAEHIRKVLRSREGDSVRVGVVNGRIGLGRILKLDRTKVALALNLCEKPASAPPLDLILAVPRPIMLKRVLAQAASMGVSRIFLINANRVEKSFFKATLIQSNDFSEPLRLGLEQAIDTRMPEISVHPRFRPFAEDLLPEIIHNTPTRLTADPAGEPILPLVHGKPLAERIILAIGPEGGWVDFELTMFKEQGFASFSMGPRILRVDTAVPALLAQLSLLRQIPPLSS
ncbi:16S rRNA (uracil(1498)-N(3))-methyltransferase [Thiovibrio sp. JS02]